MAESPQPFGTQQQARKPRPEAKLMEMNDETPRNTQITSGSSREERVTACAASFSARKPFFP